SIPFFGLVWRAYLPLHWGGSPFLIRLGWVHRPAVSVNLHSNVRRVRCPKAMASTCVGVSSFSPFFGSVHSSSSSQLPSPGSPHSAASAPRMRFRSSLFLIVPKTSIASACEEFGFQVSTLPLRSRCQRKLLQSQIAA